MQAKDLSDLHAELGREKLLPAIQASVVDAQTNGEDESKTAKRQTLTIRTINEILEMCFDDKELILTNGYLARGERTAFCGMGGVGKSRLVMQLALCCRTGTDFLGCPTQGANWVGSFYKPKIPVVAFSMIFAECLVLSLPTNRKRSKRVFFFTRWKRTTTDFFCSILKTPSA